jgi:AcrR family transcriptional regulator
MSQNQQARQPKGKREGGQFAANANPEASVVLTGEDGRRDAIVDRLIDNELRRSIAVDREKLENVDDMENDEEIELLQDVVDQQADLISRQDQRIAELALPISEEGLRELVGRAVEQTEDIKSLRQQIGELERTVPSRPILNCVYAVDEAIDELTRWDGGSGSNPTDVLENLKDVRSELFVIAESRIPEVVAAWNEREERIRAYEDHDDSISDEEYEILRDEREALFVDIVRTSLAESNETRAEVVADISWTKSDAEAMAGVSLSDEGWLRVADRFADLLANGASGDGLRDGLVALMDAPNGEVG